MSNLNRLQVNTSKPFVLKKYTEVFSVKDIIGNTLTLLNYPILSSIESENSIDTIIKTNDTIYISSALEGDIEGVAVPAVSVPNHDIVGTPGIIPPASFIKGNILVKLRNATDYVTFKDNTNYLTGTHGVLNAFTGSNYEFYVKANIVYLQNLNMLYSNKIVVTYYAFPSYLQEIVHLTEYLQVQPDINYVNTTVNTIER